MNYPRVLHVGFNPIGSPSNTGLTLASMFGGWPRSQLLELYLVSRQAQLYGGQALIASPWAAPIDAVARKLVGSRIPSPAADGMNNSIGGRTKSLPFRYRLRAAAATANEIGPVSARGKWLAPVDSFQPQVIHSLLGGVRITKFVAALADRLDVPVVPHFMDDWLDNLFADGQLLGLPRREVERSVSRILRRAPLALTIGEDMRREFETRLDLPCEVVGNSVDFATFPAKRAEQRAREVRTLTYMGGLHLGRDQTLAVVAAALDRISPVPPAKLILHTSAADDTRLKSLVDAFPRVVEAGPTLPPEQVAESLVSSDILVFVESKTPEILSFTRLSVSTKVPEYLAARRPVLVLGPAEQSSVRALMASGASSFADPDDPLAVDQAVSAVLATSERELPSLPSEQINVFDRSPTQERLRLALTRASSGRSGPCD